jgi:quercetin dioxygenase-like cupin family protein
VVLTGGTINYREGGEESSRTFDSGEVAMLEPTTHDHSVVGSPMEFLLIKIAPQAGGGAGAQEYPNLTANVVLENDQVIVQQVTAEPGNWAGDHSHGGNQLAVVLQGASMTYREGGEETVETYEDGDVYWVEETAAHDHSITGDAAWDGYVITLK